MDIKSDIVMWAMIAYVVIGMGVPVAFGCYLQAKLMNKFLDSHKTIPKIP